MVLNIPGGLRAEYPREFEQEITLKDGARVRIRPVLPEDETRLVTLYGRLSRHTAYQRFFTVMKRLSPDWAYYFANVDYRRRMALVVERDLEWRPELIGVARYEPSDEEDTAEVAIVVQDYWQGKGLGTILLGEILRAGEANGIRRFRAYALADNHRILAMLSRLTDVQERNIEQGVVDILFTRRATAVAKSRPEGQALTLFELVCAFGQANQRVLGELIELSSSVAKESFRAYAELGRNSFAWYRTSLLHAADASRRAVKFLEANAQITAAASSLPGF
jgi:RimJ/RimL family protein N-acetyltransferase